MTIDALSASSATPRYLNKKLRYSPTIAQENT